LGQRLGTLLVPGDVIALRGDLGAGKTALAQGIGEGLGVMEPVSSPTFSLVQEYRGRLPLWHLDVYRLRSPDEVVDLGWSDLLGGGGVVLVEWPERIEASLPPERLDIALEYGAAEEERRLTVTPLGERMTALVERWLALVAIG
jgi:tRNA threonylcarbamoyladenosine biosynthesis protein TsaE